jgi:hypothetical protein
MATPTAVAAGLREYSFEGRSPCEAVRAQSWVVDVRLEFNSQTGFEPPAVKSLGQIPNRFLFHRKHALRHPLATYNISIEQLASAFERVLDQHDLMYRFWREQGPSRTEPQPYTGLLFAQRVLIYSLREHLDDCHAILQSLVDPTAVNVGRPGAVTFLKAAKFPSLSTFIQPLKHYMDDYLLVIANKVKHKHGRLRGCMFYNESEAMLGYFLEEVDDREIAGPSEALHPGNTAFSFARDLRLNLLHVYLASDRLMEAVGGALKSMYGFELTPLPCLDSCNLSWRRIVQRVSDLPLAVFPQEIQLPFPDVSLTSEELMIEYPSQSRVLECPRPMRVTTITHGDGVTKSFRFPYLQAK